MQECKICNRPIKYKADLKKEMVYSEVIFPHWEEHKCKDVIK